MRSAFLLKSIRMSTIQTNVTAIKADDLTTGIPVTRYLGWGEAPGAPPLCRRSYLVQLLLRAGIVRAGRWLKACGPQPERLPLMRG